MQDNEVWSKIFPIRIGDRVRIISSSFIEERYRYSFKGLEGEVLLEVDEDIIIVGVTDGNERGYHRLKRTDVVKI